jgi:excisionase family DNA binding protein
MSNRTRAAWPKYTPTMGDKLQQHPTPTGLPPLLTIEEVAQATKLSTKTIRRLCSENVLIAYQLGRSIRIRKDSVAALLARPIA